MSGELASVTVAAAEMQSLWRSRGDAGRLALEYDVLEAIERVRRASQKTRNHAIRRTRRREFFARLRSDKSYGTFVRSRIRQTDWAILTGQQALVLEEFLKPGPWQARASLRTGLTHDYCRQLLHNALLQVDLEPGD